MTRKGGFKRPAEIKTAVVAGAGQPSDNERAIGRRVVALLRKSEILGDPEDVVDARHYVESIKSVRAQLARELDSLDPKSLLSMRLGSMQAECERFLASTEREWAAESRVRERQSTASIFVPTAAVLRIKTAVQIKWMTAELGLDVDIDQAGG